MSDSEKKNGPVRPDGMGESREVIPFGTRGQGDGMGQMRYRRGMMWSILGGACAPLSAEIAAVLTTYGLSFVNESDDRGSVKTAALVAAGAGIVVSILYNPWQIPMSVLIALVCLAMVRTVYGRQVTVGRVSLAIIAATLVVLASDSVAAAFNGTSVPAAFDGVLRQMGASYGGSMNLTMSSQVEVARKLVASYWPLAYLCAAGAIVLFAHWGTKLAARQMNVSLPVGRLSSYDAPRWVGVVFVLSAAAAMAPRYLTNLSPLVGFVGTNVLVAARVALSLQGTALIVWFLERRGFGPFTRALAVMVAVWIEWSFAVVGIVGLVDLLANFRGIGRGRQGREAGPGEKSKESA